MKVIVPFVEQTEEVRANGRGAVSGLIEMTTRRPSKQTPEIVKLILEAVALSLSACPKVYWVERES